MRYSYRRSVKDVCLNFLRDICRWSYEDLKKNVHQRWCLLLTNVFQSFSTVFKVSAVTAWQTAGFEPWRIVMGSSLHGRNHALTMTPDLVRYANAILEDPPKDPSYLKVLRSNAISEAFHLFRGHFILPPSLLSWIVPYFWTTLKNHCKITTGVA